MKIIISAFITFMLFANISFAGEREAVDTDIIMTMVTTNINNSDKMDCCKTTVNCSQCVVNGIFTKTIARHLILNIENTINLTINSYLSIIENIQTPPPNS